MNIEAPAAAAPSTEDLLKALAGARLLILEMGHKIRYLDEEGDHGELWSNDGAYVPDDRFRALDALVPLSLKPGLAADAVATPSPEDAADNAESEGAFLVIQKGEYAVHSSDTFEAAEQYRKSLADDGYIASDVIEVPASLTANSNDLYDLLDQVVEAAMTL